MDDACGRGSRFESQTRVEVRPSIRRSSLGLPNRVPKSRAELGGDALAQLGTVAIRGSATGHRTILAACR